MRALIDLLLKNPILLFIIGAWLIGMIGNVAKAQKKARERREAQTRPQPVPKPDQGATQQPVRGPTSVAEPRPAVTRRTAQPRSAEEVAREMRRILGIDQAEASARPVPTPPRPQPSREARVPPLPGGERQAEERQTRRRVDPHVGERLRDRHMQKSKVGQPRAGRSAMGSLGGRVHKSGRRAAAVSRYALDDLRTAIVLSEILAPPVSLRPHDERRPT